MGGFYGNRNKRRIFLVFAALFLIAGAALPSMAQYQNGGGLLAGHMPFSPLYAKTFAEGLEKGSVDGIAFLDAAAMRSFYEARGDRGLWRDPKGSGTAGRTLALLEESWTHGLNPEQYHVEELKRLAESPYGARAARLELLMTDAALRYVHDMGGMRVRAEDLRLKPQYWRQAEEAPALLEKIGTAQDPAAYLAGLKPQSALYDALRAELERLTQETGTYDHLLPLKFGGGLFTPGSRHADVPKLRERLGVEHKAGDGPGSFYDDRTASAVMAFQKQNGLEPDGVIGEQTLARLNQSHAGKIRQVIANLERLRWLDEGRPDRYVLVNIPSQTLYAFDEGRLAFEMNVVVGTPVRQTKPFRAEISGVRFNPRWNVPTSLKIKDFLPKLREDPSYMSDKGMEFIKGHGKDAVTLDPLAIDWNSVTPREMAGLRMVQSPGNHNALGRVRILMDNEYDIYMHDTNHKEYFARTQRTYSSGCVRLSDPEKMARFVLNRNEDWSDDRMRAVINSGRTSDIPAAAKMPVYIVYQTMWLDGNGGLVYGADVYGQDKKLVDLLASAKGYKIPAAPAERVADAAPAPAGTISASSAGLAPVAALQ